MTKNSQKNPQLHKIETLEKELEALQMQFEQSEQTKLRALADLQNFQRREAENKKNWVSLGVAEFWKALLPRLRELRLAAKHTQDASCKKVIEHWFSSLQKMGLEMIEPPAGSPLDAETCEVLVTAEGAPGTVLQVLEPGWKFKDIVLVPAKVSGAKN